MEVESIQNAPLGAFCNICDLHLAIIGLKPILGLFESGVFTQVLLYFELEILKIIFWGDM